MVSAKILHRILILCTSQRNSIFNGNMGTSDEMNNYIFNKKMKFRDMNGTVQNTETTQN
jgi:hypothetical protein